MLASLQRHKKAKKAADKHAYSYYRSDYPEGTGWPLFPDYQAENHGYDPMREQQYGAFIPPGHKIGGQIHDAFNNEKYRQCVRQPGNSQEGVSK